MLALNRQPRRAKGRGRNPHLFVIKPCRRLSYQIHGEEQQCNSRIFAQVNRYYFVAGRLDGYNGHPRCY